MYVRTVKGGRGKDIPYSQTHSTQQDLHTELSHQEEILIHLKTNSIFEGF
jgi:hypothetical protein